MKTITKALREAIRDCGMTQNALAVQAGVDPAALFRFIENERSIMLPTADKLCKVLGLELVHSKKAKA